MAHVDRPRDRGKVRTRLCRMGLCDESGRVRGASKSLGLIALSRAGVVVVLPGGRCSDEWNPSVNPLNTVCSCISCESWFVVSKRNPKPGFEELKQAVSRDWDPSNPISRACRRYMLSVPTRPLRLRIGGATRLQIRIELERLLQSL